MPLITMSSALSVTELLGVLVSIDVVAPATRRDEDAQRVLLNPASVGGWPVECLRDPGQDGARDRLPRAREPRGARLADTQATGVVEAIAAVEHFLPMMLKLPARLDERVVRRSRIVVDLLDE